MTDDLIERAFGLHDKLIECHPSLARRQVWCTTCSRTQRVENGLRDGWPKCCNYTMTIDAPEERWNTVERYPKYEVNAAGQVRRAIAGRGSVAGTILKPGVDSKGYLHVSLYDGVGKATSERVHILVAEAFLGPRSSGLEVNHKDHDRQNPALANLEYVTHSQNLSLAHGRRQIPGRRGEESGRAKLTSKEVGEIRELLTLRPDRRLLAEKYGVSKTTIDRLATGRTWRHTMTIDSPEERALLSKHGERT